MHTDKFGTLLPKPKTFISIDLETTGLHLGENGIVQIGAWATGEHEDDFKDYFVSDTDPHYPVGLTNDHLQHVRISPDALKVNGFTQDRIDLAPCLGTVIHQFHAWLKKYAADTDVLVVGQNVPFDVAWLKYEFRRNGLDNDSFRRVLDNVSLGFAVFGEAMGQARLARKLGIRCRSPHDALSDAYTSNKIFHRLRGFLLEGCDLLPDNFVPEEEEP